MIVIPSIELQRASLAAASRSVRGEPASATDPTATARVLADAGFARIQLDDCIGDVRGSASESTVENIVRDTGAIIQVAEASTDSDIERILRTGAECVIVGSRSLDDPEWLGEIVELYPETILVRTDVRDRRVVRRGWVRTLPHDILDVVEELNAFALGGVLIRGLQLDGPTAHADLALVEDLADRSRSPISVSARVTSLNDLRALEHRGAAAVVLRADQLSGELDARVVAREFGS